MFPTIFRLLLGFSVFWIWKLLMWMLVCACTSIGVHLFCSVLFFVLHIEFLSFPRRIDRIVVRPRRMNMLLTWCSNLFVVFHLCLSFPIHILKVLLLVGCLCFSELIYVGHILFWTCFSSCLCKIWFPCLEFSRWLHKQPTLLHSSLGLDIHFSSYIYTFLHHLLFLLICFWILFSS